MEQVAVRPVEEEDLPALAAIYAHYVSTTVATFDLEVPPLTTWAERWRALCSSGWPFLVAAASAAGAQEVVAVIADTSSAASTAVHRAAGFREVSRLTGVGAKHGRWVDVVLVQASLPSLLD